MTVQYRIVDANNASIQVAGAGVASGGIASAVTLVDANGNPLVLAPGSAAAAVGPLLVSSDGIKATYRSGAVAQTLDTTEATVMLEIVGSATKTVRIKKIEVWAQAGTKFYAELTLQRCTAPATGTPVVAGIGKHDTTDPVATAVVNYYTDDATLGAGAAVIGAKVLPVSPPTAGLNPQSAIWDFSRNQDKALILRGVAQVIEVYCNTTGLGTGTFGFEVEWEEDVS